MGNRVKGKPKKKSIKAALASDAGSKRKLSRMGKKQKKNHSGLEASFIGRSKCLKMLQINLKDFRRLCILKGIYPRDPNGRVPGKKKGQSFYHIKDIRAIAHEPVLEKFRDFQAFMKKVKRAAGRNDKDEALRKNSLLPTYTLHHLVKERYPRFQDALGDLDDALTLTYLFAALPGQGDISPKVTTKAQALAAAWGAYCATTSTITKSFISVKGVYVEASVHNVPIRWIVPHSFVQWMPENVDYRVMMTFFEFYETLLSFVLFRLYSDMGVRYPLTTQVVKGEVMGGTSAVLRANLRSLKEALQSSKGNVSAIVTDAVAKTSEDAQPPKKADKAKDRKLTKSVGAALNSLEPENSDEDDEDDEDVDIAGPLKAALDSMAEDEARMSIPGGKDQLSDEAVKRKRLFEGLTFFFSREIPRGYLELVVLSYGGKVGWEGEESLISAKDNSITHHIVDRPQIPKEYENLPKSREFVQPQWILDCANFMILLPIAKYAVGAPLPPHLSPWVDNEEEGYKPAYAEEIERLKLGEPVEEKEAEEMDESQSEEEEEDEKKADGESDEGDEEEEEEEEPVEKDDKKADKKKKKKKRKAQETEEDEAHELARSMMSRKAQHLYGRMQHGIAQKKQKAEDLQRRRKEIEGKKKDKTGKTVLKQKVDRLRDERKAIENTYTETGGSMKKKKRTK
eukprot:scaffold34620_cov160-Amphora_coffeaeformis.AAC.6